MTHLIKLTVMILVGFLIAPTLSNNAEAATIVYDRKTENGGEDGFDETRHTTILGMTFIRCSGAGQTSCPSQAIHSEDPKVNDDITVAGDYAIDQISSGNLNGTGTVNGYDVTWQAESISGTDSEIIIETPDE